MASDLANVFARIDGTLNSPDQVTFQLRASDFTFAGGAARIGFVVSDRGGEIDPAAVTLTNSTGQALTPVLSRDDVADSERSLALFNLGAGAYTANVSSEDGAAGGYTLELVLIGDVDGSRTVTLGDGETIRNLIGAVAGDEAYVPEADANLDGRITSLDYSYWRSNRDDATTLSPIEVSSANSSGGQPLAAFSTIADDAPIRFAGVTSPGATVEVSGAGVGSGVAGLDGSYAVDVAVGDAGPARFVVTVTDAFGQRRIEDFNFAVAESFRVTSISPTDGEERVSPDRRLVVEFSEQVDPASVTPESFRVIALGQEVPGERRVSSTGMFMTFFPAEPWTPSTEIRVALDANALRAANGDALNSDGLTGPAITADFRTLPLTRIPDTNVWGYIKDSATGAPLAGVTLHLEGFPGVSFVTDAQGRYELEDVPAPEFFVLIDGSTVTGVPAGQMYPTLGKKFPSVPGQRVQMGMGGVPMDIFLPLMAAGDIVNLSPTGPTEVGLGATGMQRVEQILPDVDPAVWQLLKVTFPAGSAQTNAGQASNQATVIPVEPTRLPGALPPNLNPKLVISVQAGVDGQFNGNGGATNFDVPAPIQYPNLEGLAIGEKALLFSFNHEKGDWEITGTGTVVDSGLVDGQGNPITVIQSDPGVGIRAPGWHFVQVGTPTAGEPCTDDTCVLVDAVREGDIVKVDLSGTVALSTKPEDAGFTLNSFTQGSWAKDSNGNVLTTGSDPFSKTGVFYFVPEIQIGPEAQGPIQPAIGSFSATLFRVNPDTGQEESIVRQGTIRLNIVQGFSGSGENAAPIGTLNAADRLDVYRVQQRLRYFGYRDRTGDNAQLIVVDGGLGDRTRHAIGVLNAAVSGVVDENHVASADVSDWINAANAPLWVEGQIPTGGMTDNEINHEHWMTSWVRDSLLAFNAAYVPDFAFNGASQRGGGDTPHHGTHEAGMDLDIDVTGAEQTDAQTQVGSTSPLTALELAIVDRMVAVYNARSVPIERILIGFQRIVDEFNAQTGTTFAQLDAGNVHDNHFHVDFQPPPRVAAAQSAFSAADNLTESTALGFGSDLGVYYRFELDGGLQLSGKTNSAGGFSEVLTPNAVFSATFYSASTNRSGRISGVANQSGFITDLGPIILNNFGGLDSDGDGIPDVGEFAIGSDPENGDSDGDGISDSAELDQGLSPVDGIAFPTGEISSLALPGAVQDVAVEGELVYAAAGSALAIIDGAQFNDPILLGQLSLGGGVTSVGVDGNLQIAAVGGAGSLHLVDVSDPMTPSLIRTATVGASHLVVFGGVAYAAAGTTLNVVDLATGDLVQTLPLPGSGDVTGLAKEGDKLYAYVSGSDTFSVIDISTEGEAAVLGQTTVSIASSDVGVFVGNGVAWLAGSGLRTVNVSDPIRPTLIHGADSFFTARNVALNGSGLAILAPDGNSYVEVYDASNPNSTANRLLQFPLSSGALDVALSRGIAYVGTSSGLSVVNYRPFDALGQPPTVTVSSSLVDQDPATPGVQVVEGGNIPLLVSVTDDVQARSVDLIVDGAVIATDVAFPFDFAVPALSQSGVTSISVQVRATDTGGNSALSDPLFFELVPDTFAPTLLSVSPADGANTFEGIQRIQLRLSEALDAASASAANFTLVEAGPSGAFGDGDDVAIPLGSVQLRSGDTILQATAATPLALGRYQLTVDQSAIRDRAGNALGAGPLMTTFTVTEFVSSPDFLPLGELLSFTDDSSRTVNPLPFDFSFFGTPVPAGNLSVRSNGTIEFGVPQINGGFNNFGLPSGSLTVAAPYFDDVDPSQGGQVGVYEGDGVRAFTWLGVPYFGRTGTVTFQIAFYANGVIEMRYGDMATPPGGTADSGISSGTATIGLARGAQAAIPSLGNIANKPDVAIAAANGIVTATGLAQLDELPGNDVLVFTPDGQGNYVITHNAGLATGFAAVQSIAATLTPGWSDFDRNGAVDGADLLAWQRGAGDADGDEASGASDLATWARQFGAGGIEPLVVAKTNAEALALSAASAGLFAGGEAFSAYGRSEPAGIAAAASIDWRLPVDVPWEEPTRISRRNDRDVRSAAFAAWEGDDATRPPRSFAPPRRQESTVGETMRGAEGATEVLADDDGGEGSAGEALWSAFAKP